jgi:three-Cys-motif partner protein
MAIRRKEMKKGRRKKDYLQWWMDRINTLKGFKEEATRLYNITNTAYETGPWGVLKLAILAYYVDVYTTIIKAKFGETYYLDLFAGPGLDLIKATNDVIFGSPLIADRATRTTKKFDKIILIEKDKAFANALEKLLPQAIIIPEDVNSGGLDKALGMFPKGRSIPFLAFVDPEGLEIQWSTLRLLLESWSDVIINYQPSAVRRAVGSISTSESFATTLTKFFGTSDWSSYGTEEDYLELYKKQIGSFKDYVIPIKVSGPKGFYYYIIVAVRKTSGMQGWINAIYRAKENIEKASYKDAEQFLLIFSGKQRTLF